MEWVAGVREIRTGGKRKTVKWAVRIKEKMGM